MEAEKMYFSATEVAAMLGVSRGKTYNILRDMNSDLAKRDILQSPERSLWNIFVKSGMAQQRPLK